MEYPNTLMQPYDLAIPILPCRSVSDTVEFYRRLGFDGKIWGEPHFYAAITRDGVEIHFFTDAALDPAKSSSGCYIRVRDVDSICKAFSAVQLPSKGIPRIDNVANKPWGMREFAIVDPDGNLIRVGQTL
jgi:catechol 2,3-dioxygenase-like lactoylglutathione lyase family enzyme